MNCFTTWSTKDWLGVEDTGFNWTELQSDSAHTQWVCLQQRVAADPTDHKTHSTTPPSDCTLLLASLPSPTSSLTSLSPSQASVDKAKARTHTHTHASSLHTASENGHAGLLAAGPTLQYPALYIKGTEGVSERWPGVSERWPGVSELWGVSEHSADNCHFSKEHRIFYAKTSAYILTTFALSNAIRVSMFL